jgi:hypothetical protein
MSPTADIEICTECRRMLLHANGALVCPFRHCPAYGVDVSEDDEDQAVDHRDLDLRLKELRAVRDALRPDVDDPTVMSEWTAINQQIGALEDRMSLR